MKYLLLVSFICLGALPLIYQSTPTEVLKLKTFDAFIEQQEPSGFFTILDITEDDVIREGGYPLPRERLAQIHIDLINEGALGVGWVIGFPQADRLGGDAMFAEALQYGGVIAMFESNNGIYPPTSGTVILGEDIGGMMSEGVIQNLDILSSSADQGIAVAPTDVDMLVRRIPMLLRTPDGFVSAFGTEVLKTLAGNDTYIIKTNELGISEITVQGLDPVPVDSLGRKWISWVNTPTTTLEEMNVAGKFVFVGVTAKGVMPQIATPVGLLEPHKIQAALSESILIKDSPRIPEYALILELTIYALSVLLVFIFISNMNVYAGVLLVLFMFSGTAYAGVSMIQTGLLVDVTYSLIMQFITGSSAFYLRFREQWKLRKQIKGQFSTYLSPDMVNILVKNPDMMKLGGERKEMTFLFTDIVGFTPISEKYKQNDDPEGLVELINSFLDQMTQIILANGGTIDKYMGDCIMAFWNAPIDCDDHANKAIKSAIDIELLAEKLNAEHKDMPPIIFGTGINTGTCIVGNMGSQSRFDYSVIGDAVNLAARLEVQTRSYDTPILVSEDTLNQSDYAMQKLDTIKVKGKEEDVAIYAPLINGELRKLHKEIK